MKTAKKRVSLEKGAGFGALAHTDEMQDFRKLSVWREAMALAVLIYQRTEYFPIRER